MIAVAFGTINIVGGFLVTDRMLEMFKSKPKPKRSEEAGGPDGGKAGGTGTGTGAPEGRTAPAALTPARGRARDRAPARHELPAERKLHLRPLHHRVRPVHPGPARPRGADDRGARQPHRGGRHGDRGDRDAAEPRRGQLGSDRAGHRTRRGRRRARGAPGEDDGDAADGRAVQRRRRRRGGADLVGRVSPPRLDVWLAYDRLWPTNSRAASC